MVEREERGTEARIVFGIRWDGGKPPRTTRWMAAVAAIAAALVPAAAAQASPMGARAATSQEVLVVPARGHAREARALVERLGGHPAARIGIARGFSARVPAGALARLRQSAAVRDAAPDAPLTVSSHDDGGAIAAATSMAVVRSASGAQGLQDSGVDGSGIGVALVDSGAMTVEGLDSGQVVPGPDFSTESGDPALAGLDAFGHGTHLAGIIAGHDDDGFTGVAPGSHIVSVKVADADGTTSLIRVLRGLGWVYRNAGDPALGLRVVNLSLGVDATDAGYVRDPLAFAAEQLWHRGLVVVTAAGNGGAGATSLDLPAADPYLIAVGADDTNGTADTGDDRVASFSSRSKLRPPDVVAPGTGVVSLRVPGSALDMAFPAARMGDRFFRGSGTSQATAVVSGLAALLLQARPGLAPDQVKALLEDGASPVAADGAGAAQLTTATRAVGRSRRGGNGRWSGGQDPATATDDPLVAAEGDGLVDAAASAALPAPELSAVAQQWPRAVLDTRQLAGRRVGAGEARWDGRRWSGRTWSGRTWSGRTWSGASFDADPSAP